MCYNDIMKTTGQTDYRKVDAAAVYEAKKIVIRLWKSKKSVEEIMEATDFSRDTVYSTISAYKKGGTNALRPKKRGRKTGEKRTLTPEQEKELVSLLVDHQPDQLKIKGCMWTRESVQELIQRKYGITMPIRTIGEYLRRWGFTVQRPAKRAMNQKSEQVQKWLEEEYPAIKASAKVENAEIFWGDETAVQNESNYARGYAPKGQTPVLAVQTVKMHINMVSAISNQGKLHFLLYSDAMNADRLIEFMQAIIKDAGRMVYLILDDLRVHHSKKVMAWVEENHKKIRLFHLPPYSPEYDPDEYLNHDLKRSIGSQAQAKTVDDIQDNTRTFMDALQDDSEHVKSYFRHPKVKGYL